MLACAGLQAGDEVLLTDHGYGAVRIAAERACADVGARVVVATVPLDANDDDVVERVLAAVTPRTRLAVLDQVTSATARVMPLARLVPALQERGVVVCIDAAHAPGMLDVDLARLAPDYWTGNLHKWAWAPRGTRRALCRSSPAGRPASPGRVMGRRPGLSPGLRPHGDRRRDGVAGRARGAAPAVGSSVQTGCASTTVGWWSRVRPRWPPRSTGWCPTLPRRPTGDGDASTLSMAVLALPPGVAEDRPVPSLEAAHRRARRGRGRRHDVSRAGPAAALGPGLQAAACRAAHGADALPGRLTTAGRRLPDLPADGTASDRDRPQVDGGRSDGGQGAHEQLDHLPGRAFGAARGWRARER